MLIKQRRIRNIDTHLAHIKRGTTLVVGLRDIRAHVQNLVKAGFTSDLTTGEAVIPDATFGPVSRFNAHGKDMVHKDQPMETAYRMSVWHWKEWHGPYSVEQSKIVDIPYKRYPRTFVAPPGVELQLAVTTNGEPIVIAPPLAYDAQNKTLLAHTINLFLEIFGECFLFDDGLAEIVKTPVNRLNWHVLPAGRWPWVKLKPQVESLLEEAPDGNHEVIVHRFETINSYEPDFVAIGRAGFRGYIIFGFQDAGLYVLESSQTANATYVFGERWEDLSQLSKAEILEGNLQSDRIIHRKNWPQRVKALLSSAMAPKRKS